MTDPQGWWGCRPVEVGRHLGGTMPKNFELPTGQRERIATHDTPEQIDECQRCRLPDCNNCAEHHRKRDRYRRFLELHQTGLTDEALSRVLGVTLQTVKARRKRLGLSPNLPPLDRDPCEVCRSRSLCRDIGGSCRKKDRYERERNGTAAPTAS